MSRTQVLAAVPSRPGLRLRGRDPAVVLVAFALELFTSGAGLGPTPSTLDPEVLVPRWLVGAVVLLMAGLLLLRRRHPMAVFLAEVALSSLLIAVVAPAQPVFCMLVALYSAASRGTRTQSLATLPVSVAYVGMIMWSIIRFYDEPIGPGEWLFPAVGFTFLMVVIWALGRRDWVYRNRTADLRDELVVRGEQAAAAERQRIARELHDIVAHSVSAMMMQAAGARAMTRSVARDVPEDGRLSTVEEALGTIENTGAQSMRELHRLLGVLRDGPVDEDGALDLDRDRTSSTQPGLDDLEDLIEVPRQSGLIIEVHHSGVRQTVDPSVGGTAYRVVQESLTNALKHAGRGAVVDIYLSWQGKDLQVQVRSRGMQDARRPGTPNSGAGLRGLHERVGLVGGSFHAGWGGEEFVTTAVLPVHPGGTR